MDIMICSLHKQRCPPALLVICAQLYNAAVLSALFLCSALRFPLRRAYIRIIRVYSMVLACAITSTIRKPSQIRQVIRRVICVTDIQIPLNTLVAIHT